MPTALENLKATGTTVVCDSGDYTTTVKYKPQDATTNPFLILEASRKPQYAHLVDAAVDYGRSQGSSLDDKVDAALDRLLVEFGREILKVIPGRVSTEVDARFSFDTNATVEKALHIVNLYEAIGVSKDRVLIKIAATWEGIQATKILQREHGVNCNLTLIFSIVQAITAAEAGAFLISPFVARIKDWYKATTGQEHFTPQEHPGVKSVRAIFNYYKRFGYKTIVMGASFREKAEVFELAGCDYLTIPPTLLEELMSSQDHVEQSLKPEDAASLEITKKSYIENKADFRFDMNEDAMASEKLREGISKFAADAVTLKDTLKKKLEDLQS